jgi:hypothetical protein
MAGAAISRLTPGGRLILYTGSATVAGEDLLRNALIVLAREGQCRLHYRELDPDVFGEELTTLCYHDVDRIAVVAATFTRDPV